jgi:hypothetical protein
MLEQIINFFQNIDIQDYIISFISVWFFIVFIFVWIEKIYKAYLWIILWLFIFTMINLTLKSLNDNDIWVNIFRDFFINHREWLWFYSILFIPILAILIPLNHNITFRVSKNKMLNYFFIFLFWIFFFPFLLTIFLSIINNRFLFSIDNSIITQIRESYIIKSLYEYFQPSFIFNLLTKYDYVINLIIILFIFYKMTIGWVVDFIMVKLFKFLVNFFENKTKSSWNKTWHDEHHDEHWHSDSHWHWWWHH